MAKVFILQVGLAERVRNDQHLYAWELFDTSVHCSWLITLSGTAKESLTLNPNQDWKVSLDTREEKDQRKKINVMNLFTLATRKRNTIRKYDWLTQERIVKMDFPDWIAISRSLAIKQSIQHSMDLSLHHSFKRSMGVTYTHVKCRSRERREENKMLPD